LSLLENGFAIGITFRHYLSEIALDLGIDDCGRFLLKGAKNQGESGGNIQLRNQSRGRETIGHLLRRFLDKPLQPMISPVAIMK
jgi:hypothetical protein